MAALSKKPSTSKTDVVLPFLKKSIFNSSSSMKYKALFVSTALATAGFSLPAAAQYYDAAGDINWNGVPPDSSNPTYNAPAAVNVGVFSDAVFSINPGRDCQYFQFNLG